MGLYRYCLIGFVGSIGFICSIGSVCLIGKNRFDLLRGYFISNFPTVTPLLFRNGVDYWSLKRNCLP